MSGKGKASSDVKALKGQEAEDCVLEYVKRMNRPYGAVDVAANLKGAVAKSAVQKILVALAEKGELVQKTYGKTTFFVANQAKIEEMPAEKQAALEAECKSVEEDNKQRAAQVKALSAELAKLKTSLTDAQVKTEYEQIAAAISKKTAQLADLRVGVPPISEQELSQLDADWTRWKSEWIRRKKVYMTLWHLVTDALPPQDSAALAEDLGIELDTAEHQALERNTIFTTCGTMTKSGPLKRKREPEN